VWLRESELQQFYPEFVTTFAANLYINFQSNISSLLAWPLVFRFIVEYSSLIIIIIGLILLYEDFFWKKMLFWLSVET
jgi:hypothetical protein